VGQLPLDFICPQEVVDEIAAGVAVGHPDLRPEWLTVLELSKPVDPVARATLDLGEAAVIQLALEQQVARVCLDDRKGRRAARAVKLEVTGSLGLLVRAKTLGIIPALRPHLERMLQQGAYYDEELVRRVLEGVDE
jgi:predicted nucleic acid-binding protein